MHIKAPVVSFLLYCTSLHLADITALKRKSTRASCAGAIRKVMYKWCMACERVISQKRLAKGRYEAIIGKTNKGVVVHIIFSLLLTPPYTPLTLEVFDVKP
jgi:hypothetical protein